MYSSKVYPGVLVDGMDFGGKTKEEVAGYFDKKSREFYPLELEFSYEGKIATVSAEDLKIGYDSNLSAEQAFSIGRSSNFLSNQYQKWRASVGAIYLPSQLTMDMQVLDEQLEYFASLIDKPAEDALFKFDQGKVTVFKPSRKGLTLNKTKTKEEILEYLLALNKNGKTSAKLMVNLTIEELSPKVTTGSSNNYGIKELVGVGNSKFRGSIAGRIHNIELAASRLNGRMIAPGETFSFNNALGDVSAATGFQPAYVIKDGRTVLGDGGGVCQVSTTLFRAALNAGLAIEERNAHSYRVSYYEQDSAPGIDATVFAPSVDLKFKNDTSNYLLIQAITDKSNYSLSFELYGTNDGRVAEITKPVILSQSAAPPDLYQDDPTLPVGTVKQVDWRAAGAKVNFDYKVVRNDEVIFQKSFFSNFQPWQAVFLRGTKTG